MTYLRASSFSSVIVGLSFGVFGGKHSRYTGFPALTSEAKQKEENCYTVINAIIKLLTALDTTAK